MAIKLDRQVYIYSVDTSFFYNEKEQEVHNELFELAIRKNEIKSSADENNAEEVKEINKRRNELKAKLVELFGENNEVRKLREGSMKETNVISIFDSVLTRVIGLKPEMLSDDIIVVQTYYFQILEDIIHNGFIYKGEKYRYFTSSAGQIRTKKSVFIKERLWERHSNTLMCGLSIKEINDKGGVNTNKFQAYLALSNSATDEWQGFNIHKSIVVDDLETDVYSLVDHIHDKDYKITRQEMNIPIEHTDGCGMILPTVNKKSFMVRLPWIKGLLVPFDYKKFINAHEGTTSKVKDIYGKEWDIIKDDIQIIFTKSQFKMWKYYNSWDSYKDRFIKYDCQAAMLNEEDVTADANLNYQMIQTLTDITKEELIKISESTITDILRIGSNKDTMLRVLGATKTNKRKNYMQEALFIYPELLNDPHSKEVIKDKKRSLVKDAKAGKLSINGKYTFIIPDLYAFCEKLFLNRQPKGLLKRDCVYCDIFEDGKVDVLRSPHLYREHAVRNNIHDEKIKEWFITHGLYTSIHDPISKILQFDVDGDKALVVQDDTFVAVAERNMEGIVPLYYKMAKADSKQITPENIYEALVSAYKANIGEISNNITKIWNSNNVNLNVIKWLCMENNFTIDYAKTLYMPRRPLDIHKTISKYIKTKVPHFFVYAKNKEKRNVEKINDSVVNMLNEIIPNKRINFVKVAGKLDYKNLMKNSRVDLDEEIIKKYIELDRSKRYLMKDTDGKRNDKKLYVYKYIKNELLKINSNADYVTDVLVKYLYSVKKSKNKQTIWWSFGDILLKNIKRNVLKVIECVDCGEIINSPKHKQIRCNNCQYEKQKEWQRNSMKKKRKENK